MLAQKLTAEQLNNPNCKDLLQISKVPLGHRADKTVPNSKTMGVIVKF